MRKSTLRSLLILGGAFVLLAAFAPRANADCPGCIRYYNFEGDPTSPYPVNLDSHFPALEIGGGMFGIVLNTGTDPTMAATGAYPDANTNDQPGIPLNVGTGDPGPNDHSLGTTRSGQHQLYMDIFMPSAGGIYDVTSVSFAYGANGNGYAFVQLFMSTNNGATFTAISALTPLPATPGAIVNLTVTPAGTTLNHPDLVLRLAFTGGQSNGNDQQNEFDNIQVNGTIVPEPATVAGGLLGVLGLCWHQRRRLIRSVRFRKA